MVNQYGPKVGLATEAAYLWWYIVESMVKEYSSIILRQ